MQITVILKRLNATPVEKLDTLKKACRVKQKAEVTAEADSDLEMFTVLSQVKILSFIEYSLWCRSRDRN